MVHKMREIEALKSIFAIFQSENGAFLIKKTKGGCLILYSNAIAEVIIIFVTLPISAV